MIIYSYVMESKNGAVDRSKTSIGNINPFRYRGYYYDTETGFYYLQTRYYDPTICRFINADNYELVAELSQTIGQLNLYAYANNNPIMLTDETGEGVLTAFLLGTLIGSLVGATTYTVSQLISYKRTGEWSWSWGEFAGNTIGGGLGGGLSALGLGVVAVGLGGASSSAIGMSLQNAFEGTNYTFGNILDSSLRDGIISMIGYKIMGRIKISGVNAGSGSYSAVSQQIMTKLKRDLISKISLKTFFKMYIADFCGSAMDIVKDVYGG